MQLAPVRATRVGGAGAWAIDGARCHCLAPTEAGDISATFRMSHDLLAVASGPARGSATS